MTSSSNPGAYPTVYGLWTNKGGVGKTTLTFHLATTYAKLYPKKKVIVIDMCPQCNISATLLTKTTLGNNNRPVIAPGDAVVHRYQETDTINGDIARTVAGFINRELNMAGNDFTIDQWLIPVNEINGRIPENLLLLCGDSLLDAMVNDINSACGGGAVNALSGAYKKVMTMMRTFVTRARDYYHRTEKQEVVVFIDTNPALTVYTQLALTAMTQLIVPVSADNFSLQAVSNLFHLVYGLYPRTVGPAAQHEESTFASKARRHGLPVPQICCIVHNKTPVFRNIADEAGAVGFIPPQGFKHMALNQATMLYKGYMKAAATDQLSRVFRPNKQPGGIGIGEIENFSRSYTGTMRDMRSCGVASMHTGLPLWTLVADRALIPRTFRGVDFERTVPYLVRDICMMLKLILGEQEYNRADADALNAMPQIPNGDAAEEADDDDDDDDNNDDNGNNGGGGPDGDDGGRGGRGGNNGGGGGGGGKPTPRKKSGGKTENAAAKKPRKSQ